MALAVDMLRTGFSSLAKGIQGIARATVGLVTGTAKAGVTAASGAVSGPAWLMGKIGQSPLRWVIAPIVLALTLPVAIYMATRKKEVKPESAEVTADKQAQLQAAYQRGITREMQDFQTSVTTAADRQAGQPSFVERLQAENNKGSLSRGA